MLLGLELTKEIRDTMGIVGINYPIEWRHVAFYDLLCDLSRTTKRIITSPNIDRSELIGLEYVINSIVGKQYSAMFKLYLMGM